MKELFLMLTIVIGFVSPSTAAAEGGIDFRGMSSSALIKNIVTMDRVDLMKSMKNNNVFIMSLARQMRDEFKDHALSQYEEHVRLVLRFVETTARDGKNLDRSLEILEQIANEAASSGVGSTFRISCERVK